MFQETKPVGFAALSEPFGDIRGNGYRCTAKLRG